METTNIGKVFLPVIIITFILSFIVLKTAGFEVAVIFAISLLAGCIMGGLTGVENIIILTKEGK